VLARSVADHLMASGNMPVHISGGIEGEEWERMTEEEKEGTDRSNGILLDARKWSGTRNVWFNLTYSMALSYCCFSFSFCFVRARIPVLVSFFFIIT